MDGNEVADALGQFPTLRAASIVPILGGWANWTFEVDGCWILRFPRTETVAGSTARELAVLPILESVMTVAIPSPRWIGEWNGRPFFGYRKILGWPLSAEDPARNAGLASQLARTIGELHSVDLDRVRTRLGIDGSKAEWTGRYEELRRQSASAVFPLLSTKEQEHLKVVFDRFLARGFDFEPVLVHRDLGSDHILIDSEDGTLSGLIDFEDVTIGDPAIDFVGLQIALGQDQTREIVKVYGSALAGVIDDAFFQRVTDYCWIGSLHAVLHGVATENHQILVDGLDGLKQRLPAT